MEGLPIDLLLTKLGGRRSLRLRQWHGLTTYGWEALDRLADDRRACWKSRRRTSSNCPR